MKINKISYVKNLSSRKSPKIFDTEDAKIDTLVNQAVAKSMSKCRFARKTILTRLTR